MLIKNLQECVQVRTLSRPGLTGAARSTLGQDHRYLIKRHSLQVVPAMEAQKRTVSLGSLGFKKASK